MGCDIHLIAEVRRRYIQGETPREYWTRVAPPEVFRCPRCSRDFLARSDVAWIDAKSAMRAVTCWYCDRNYDTFAILANVRNGYGFAGCDTGDGFVPIAVPRGLPADLGTENAARDGHDGYYYDGFWLGDHSHSWLTLRELLDYEWMHWRTLKRGVIPWSAFVDREAAGETGPPKEYCAEIAGPGIVTLSEDEARRWRRIFQAVKSDGVHVRATWGTSYRAAAGEFCDRVIPGLQALGAAPEDVRIVFGFDS